MGSHATLANHRNMMKVCLAHEKSESLLAKSTKTNTIMKQSSNEIQKKMVLLCSFNDFQLVVCKDSHMPAFDASSPTNKFCNCTANKMVWGCDSIRVASMSNGYLVLVTC